MHRMLTYWKEEIDNIHDAQDQVGNLNLMIPVCGKDQKIGNDVVGKHLPIILSTLLNVHDHDLLKPECELDQSVPF